MAVITPTDIIQIIKNFGYPNVSVKSNSKNHLIKIKMPGKERRMLLEKLYTVLQKYKIPIEKKNVSNLSSTGHLKLENIYIVAKPDAGPGTLHIFAKNLLSKGTKEKQTILGIKNTNILSFSNPDFLRSSILETLKSNTNIHEGIIETFQTYFKNMERNPHIIEWYPTVTETEKNELGIYIGEVLPGIVGFFQNGLDKIFSFNPLKKTLKKFIVPNDVHFPGIDSIFEDLDGGLLIVSNKYGGGAPASFFSNILPGLLASKNLPPGYFSKFVNRMKSQNIPPTKAVDAIYTFGIRDILKISSKDIPDPVAIYRNLATRTITKESSFVVEAVRNYTNDPTILKYLTKQAGYSSLTLFFTREIAQRFNKDAAGIEKITTLLSGKNFWQATLNNEAWKKGKIQYKLVTTKKVKIKFLGKTSPSDIRTKYGTINYFLRAE